MDQHLTKRDIKFDNIVIDVLVEDMIRARIVLDGEIPLPHFLIERADAIAADYLEKLIRRGEEQN